MGGAEMVQIATWIDAVLRNPEDCRCRTQIADQVRTMCARFPM
jgi:glycine/serine hydroxymethyltransferase